MNNDWNKSFPKPPETLDEWMGWVERRLRQIHAAPRGIAARGWDDVVALGPGFVVADARRPGWRRTADGRVELRGRLRKTSGNVVSGDVVMYLPNVCAPPNNEQIRSAVSVLGPATNEDGEPGVCRFDIQREAAWKTGVLLDAYGEPVIGEDGGPVIVRESLTEVIARPPGPPAAGIAGWIGLDHAVYDPTLYVDTLEAVPRGQEPLVQRPGVAVVQQPNGEVVLFTPGVKWS